MLFKKRETAMGIVWFELVFVNLIIFLIATKKVNSQSSQTCDGNYTVAGDILLCEYLLDPIVEGEFSQQCNTLKQAEWNYTTNVSDETKEDYVEEYKNFLELFSASVQNETLIKFNGTTFGKFGTTKAANLLKTMGPNDMNATNYNRMRNLENKFQADYDAITVCRWGTTCVTMTLSDIQQALKVSTDLAERDYYFKEWHDAVSNAISVSDFYELVKLQNEYARANGFLSMSHMLLEPYNDGSGNWTAEAFFAEMEELWQSIKPSFENTRRHTTDRLRQIPEYANRIDSAHNIQISLLNDLWGEDLSNLAHATRPYQLSTTLDDIVTAEMITKKKDAEVMFMDGNRLMTLVGLENLLQESYGWKDSIINKTQVPIDQEIICEPQSIDFCEDPFKYRIRMCTETNMEDFVTVHEELAKVEYFFAYKHLPYVFRSGANPAMPPALSKALGLAAQSPKYLNCHLKFYLGDNLQFCDNNLPTPSPTTETPETTTEDTSESPVPFSIEEEDSDTFDFNELNRRDDKIAKESEIKSDNSLPKATIIPNVQNEEANYLYKLHLKYFSAPYALAVEKWRWEVYNGLDTADYNKRWWELRQEFQGLIPPVARGSGLDAASKFDVISNKPYIDEFVSHIVQFQIFENLCKLANQYDKSDVENKFLHRCVLPDAEINLGERIYNVMKCGSEVPWPEALKNLTGSERISPGPILDFYIPVKEALDEVNRPGKGSSTAAIIVGIILGVAVGAICCGFLVGRRITKSKKDYQVEHIE